MTSVTRLSAAQFAMLMQYKGKLITWQHPYSSISNWGVVIGIENGFLLVKDSVATEGIKEEWVVYVSQH